MLSSTHSLKKKGGGGGGRKVSDLTQGIIPFSCTVSYIRNIELINMRISPQVIKSKK